MLGKEQVKIKKKKTDINIGPFSSIHLHIFFLSHNSYNIIKENYKYSSYHR